MQHTYPPSKEYKNKLIKQTASHPILVRNSAENCKLIKKRQCVQNKDNLIEIRTQHLSPESGISICVLNSQSCRNKASELCDFVLEKKVDNHILALIKTWLKADNSDNCVRSELTPEGYRLADIASRTRGGGVGLLYESSSLSFLNEGSFDVKTQKITISTTSYECLEVLLNAGSSFIRLLVLHRPPSGEKSGKPTTSTFFE